MDSTTILGLVAGSLTSLCIVPQVYRIWQRKSAKDVSYRMYFALSSGVSLWIVYGVLKDEIAIIVTNAMSLVLNLALIYLKWNFRNNTDDSSDS